MTAYGSYGVYPCMNDRTYRSAFRTDTHGFDHAGLDIGSAMPQDYFDTYVFQSGVQYCPEDGNVYQSNFQVAMNNARIVQPSLNHLISPMVCADGRYPADFLEARRLEDVLQMSDDRLHRIMMAYNLVPGGVRYNQALGCEQLEHSYGHQIPISNRMGHMIVLFNFLAARRIADDLRRYHCRDPALVLGPVHGRCLGYC